MKHAYNTKQRENILRVLRETNGSHITADGLAALLQEQGTPVWNATIYRYLEALVEQGMVRKYVMEGASACYQYIDAASACAQHHHFKCTGCGRLFHIDCAVLQEMEAHLLREHHLKIDPTRTVLYGQCPECAGKDEVRP